MVECSLFPPGLISITKICIPVFTRTAISPHPTVLFPYKRMVHGTTGLKHRKERPTRMNGKHSVGKHDISLQLFGFALKFRQVGRGYALLYQVLSCLSPFVYIM